MNAPPAAGLAPGSPPAAAPKIVTQPVAYEHAGVTLEGFLAYDEARSAAGRLPGVLLAPEWWGLNAYIKGRADQIARLGYVAFALDMYGKGIVTTDAKEASERSGRFYGKPLMAERAQAGLDQLLQTGRVDGARVAAIGYCFGGAIVQALAYSGAPLAGIVSFHGGLIPVPADAARKNRARILICNGAIDGFVSAEARVAFHRSMDEGKFDYQFIDYAGAVHAFTNPDADRMSALNHLDGLAYNAAADRRSWAHLRVFFDEILAPGV